MKQYYDLKKVVDPHSHMPKGIRAHFFDGMRHPEMNNDTFVHWTVGDNLDEHEAILENAEAEEVEETDEIEYEEEYEEEEEDLSYEESIEHLAKVDEWLLKHDFKKGEEIIVLFWW